MFGTGVAAAQTATAPNAAAQQSPQGGYTLQAHVREVITDVTVTDRQGNPVHGLPESAFHIFDNGKPQRLASFQEHTSAESVPIEDGPENVFNNNITLHPPAVFNVLLLDTASIDIVDQMYLRQELDRFINGLPPNEPFAVFLRSSEHAIMVANFTSDRQKLLKAVDDVVPRLRRPGFPYANDLSLMEEICTYLQQYPGRKNVLWFTGGSNLLLRPDPESISAYANLRPIYDDLERGRIALYPIDARGLLVSHFGGLAAQQLMMGDEANATGGQAIFNNNGLAQAARHIADTGTSFYTLVYSPTDVKLDNKWHNVKVKLDGGDYQLSYRRGYFDDGSNLKQAESSGRKRLLKSGDAVPELRLQPINFQVTVAPAAPAQLLQQNVLRSSPNPPRRGERAYTLHYSLPLHEFPQKTNGDDNQFSLGLGVLAFNQYGRSISRIADKITLGVSREHLDNAAPNATLSFNQLINLPDGEDFLYVAVWNIESGRVGVVQIPLAVEKPKLH
jgi:VWFA-related protein